MIKTTFCNDSEIIFRKACFYAHRKLMLNFALYEKFHINLTAIKYSTLIYICMEIWDFFSHRKITPYLLFPVLILFQGETNVR